MEFTIKTTPLLSNDESLINIKDDTKWLTLFIKDHYGDKAVISLPEPHRSEFIRRIKELKTNG